MRIGRLQGIEVRLNPLFLVLLGLYFVAGVLEKGLIIFGLVLFHELAHTLVAKMLGIPVINIELLPFGGVARMGSEMSVQPSKEIAVALAGPVSNILLIGLALGLKNYGIWSEELGPYFLQINLMLALFNLLPALPLDGGRVLRSLLATYIGVSQATLTAARIGQITAVAVICLGVMGFLQRIVGLDVIIIALFVLYAASKEKNLTPYLFVCQLAHKKEELIQTGILPVEQLAVQGDVPLKEIVKLFVPQKFHLILLFNRQMELQGQVSEAQVVDALFQQGMDVPVGSLIKPDLKG